ncbi:MAG: redoxin family protein [Bacteroidota bacterium]|nr:redoxin family protein [Bacteroidota bacterium]
MKIYCLALLMTLISLSICAQKDINVYVFIGEECPVCNFMGKPLKLIYDKYQKEADFHIVFPLKNSNYKTSQLFKEQYGLLAFETILDKDQKVTKELGATVTPEVIVTDDTNQVVYRGRINSAYYAPGKMKHSSIKDDLDLALASLISRQPVATPWPAAVGCYITIYAAK